MLDIRYIMHIKNTNSLGVLNNFEEYEKVPWQEKAWDLLLGGRSEPLKPTDRLAQVVWEPLVCLCLRRAACCIHFCILHIWHGAWHIEGILWLLRSWRNKWRNIREDGGWEVWQIMKSGLNGTHQWACTWSPVQLLDVLLMPLASLRLIPLARLSHRYPGKDCYRTMKPHLMCFAWLYSNDTIQREMGIIWLLPPH